MINGFENMDKVLDSIDNEIANNNIEYLTHEEVFSKLKMQLEE